MSNLMMMKMWLTAKLGKYITDEKGEVNIVATVVLIGIAVTLAIVFKDAISELINNLLETISGKAQDAIS